ncbi:MAG: GIY-YIG nuclease family protein [Planctomycetes bacterium]|jgi:putative endonuclease|nr:GIY-YIG nuclease family protein [Planctomycetota bacterium]
MPTPVRNAARTRPRKVRRAWTVYLLRCADGTLYCGCTTDLARRIREHAEGRGARYTRGRGPFERVALRRRLTRSAALRLEAAVKRKSRREKAAFLLAKKKRAGRPSRP